MNTARQNIIRSTIQSINQNKGLIRDFNKMETDQPEKLKLVLKEIDEYVRKMEDFIHQAPTLTDAELYQTVAQLHKNN